jgi:hypothetical protein
MILLQYTQLYLAQLSKKWPYLQHNLLCIGEHRGARFIKFFNIVTKKLVCLAVADTPLHPSPLCLKSAGWIDRHIN